MRESWLHHLADPADGTPLQVQASFAEEGDHLMNGVLQSAGGRRYPVMRGVPVFVENIGELYGGWVETHASALGAIPEAWLQGAYEPGTRKVQDSFGYEWSRYHRLLPDYDRSYVHQTGIDDAFYLGKTILDAGCGYGRHVSYIAGLEGTTVVGIDLSEAVFIAFGKLRDRPNVILAQGNLYRPPLRPAHFDFVYSWGVLHHTPSVEQGFRSILPLVRPGGQISFGAYRNWSRLGTACQRGLRALTCRLPRDLLYTLCYGAVPLNWLYSLLLRHIPLVEEGVRVFIKPARDWRICHTDTFDWWHPYYNHYHTLQELRDMVARAHLRLESDDVPYNSVRAAVPAP
ncbi:MAG: methyltransferase domain-containing protein [Gemmatimonadota bacterium]